MSAGRWLRVVLYDMRDVAFDHFETPLRYMRSSIDYFSAVLQKQPGFEAAEWGYELDDGKVAAVTHWADGEAIEGARAELQRLAADAEAHGIHRMHVANIELFPVPTLAGEGGAGERPWLAPESWMRVVTYAVRADGHAQEYMVGHIQDFQRVLERQPGFLRGYWGRDVAGGTMAAVTCWESRRAIVSAREALQKLQVEAAAEGVRSVDVHNLHLFAVTPPRDAPLPSDSARVALAGFVDAVQARRAGG
jgi:heme-degrading monooxygenase HmoA